MVTLIDLHILAGGEVNYTSGGTLNKRSTEPKIINFSYDRSHAQIGKSLNKSHWGQNTPSHFFSSDLRVETFLFLFQSCFSTFE